MAVPSPQPVEAVRGAWWLFALLLGYVALRLLFLPKDPTTCVGFGHDSAYITHVADNLLAERGYVLDTLWLVFLNPERLPMPFHNANPLFPTVIAGVSLVTGISTATAGFAVSAAAHAGLILALYVLLGRFLISMQARLAITVAATCFPPIYDDSLAVMPDTLCLALLIAACACLVRTESLGGAALAGVFFGLSWLCRSSAVLTAPAMLVFLGIAEGWRRACPRMLLLAGTTLLVCLPWFGHTALVWGSPFRSDAGYYLMQDYHARAHGISVERYWHGSVEPPALGALLRREPVDVIGFMVQGVPVVLYKTFASWSRADYAVAALLLVLTIASLITLIPWSQRQGDADDRSRRAALVSYLVAVMTSVLGFAPRAESYELRYLAVPSLLFACLLSYGAISAWSGFRQGSGTWRLGCLVIVLLSGLYWVVVVPLTIQRMYELSTTIDETRISYFRLAQRVVDHHGSDRPFVVGDHPYFFTLATKAAALSIPDEENALLPYMDRYHARHVVLKRAEVEFWRPRWLDPGGLPPELVRGADWEGFLVFERRDRP